jgi:hypothetical protein
VPLLPHFPFQPNAREFIDNVPQLLLNPHERWSLRPPKLTHK